MSHCVLTPGSYGAMALVEDTAVVEARRHWRASTPSIKAVNQQLAAAIGREAPLANQSLDS